MAKRGRLPATAPVGLDRRNAEMLRRYEAGETLASIGVGLGFTRERVRQIVRQSGAPMPREYKCAVKACNTSPRSPHRYCQSHQRRLERYGDPLGTKPLLMDQHGTLACYKRGRCSCDLCRKANADRAREYEHRVHPEMRRYAVRTP
jgi:hypothetical protein